MLEHTSISPFATPGLSLLLFMNSSVTSQWTHTKSTYQNTRQNTHHSSEP